MRRFFLLTLLAILFIPGCRGLVDKEIDSLQEQIDLLKREVEKANGSLESIRSVLSQMETGGRISAIAPIEEGGRTGYRITFNDGTSIQLWNGVEGAKGDTGPSASIAVQMAEDGFWYWTLDGAWLQDGKGNRIRVTGDKGVTPELKIENKNWYLSYGEGWMMLGPATGADGHPVTFFSSVEQDGRTLVVTFLDGSQVRLPVGMSLQMESGIRKVHWNTTYSFPFTVEGANNNTLVVGHASPGYHAEVKNGNLVVQTPSDGDIGTVTLFVSDGCGGVLNRSLTLDPLIEFKDPVAKRLCVAEWDTDKDGELSLLEVRQATSFPITFAKNNDLVSMDELRYFKSLSYIDGGMTAFYNTPALVSVTLPSSIRDLSSCYLFFQQSGLKILTVLAVVPPTLCTGFWGFSGTGARPVAIYVPDQSVDLYKAAPYWKDRASIIKPLSEKPAD